MLGLNLMLLKKVIIGVVFIHTVFFLTTLWNSRETMKLHGDNFGPLPDYSASTVDINCSAVYEGNEAVIHRWKDYSDSMDEDFLLKSLNSSCEVFLGNRGYPKEPNSQEEELFPIAYSISAHKGAVQLERLLRLIYWPQNLYCIHIDQKASPSTHRAVRALASCFTNVFLTKSELVYWGGYGVLKAVLNCASDLVKRRTQSNWKYFINIGAEDFPLKTNLQLVKIMKSFNGSNDVELTPEFQFNRYWFPHILVTSSQGVFVTRIPNFQKSKLPVPHGLKVYKGNLAATLSREFVEFLLSDSKVGDFIIWLNDTDTPDEHLWSTVNHNQILNAPGRYPGNCPDNVVGDKGKDWISRYVKWRHDNSSCHGSYVRDVCIFGLGDIQELIKRRELFANKLYLDVQSKTYTCLEQWHLEKVKNLADVDLEIYQQLGIIYKLRDTCSR